MAWLVMEGFRVIGGGKGMGLEGVLLLEHRVAVGRTAISKVRTQARR